VAGSRCRVCVHIEPEHMQCPCVVVGELLHGGRDLCARHAPRRPEIHQREAAGGKGLRVEVRARERGYMRRVGQ